MRLLDLFCKAGGAAMGYHRAGFEVVGVDLEPQPNYPFEFHQLDALALVRDRLAGCWHESYSLSSLPGMSQVCLGRFDAVHASPPCQRWSALAALHPDVEHPDLIGPTRDLLVASGLPYVIENVERSPLVDPILLCGSMFDPPLDVRRHRLFETNWGLGQHDWPCRHKLWAPRFPPEHLGMKQRGRLSRVVGVYGGGRYAGSDALRAQAMGIDWMRRGELTQAIPPAYTEWIGKRLGTHLLRLTVQEAG